MLLVDPDRCASLHNVWTALLTVWLLALLYTLLDPCIVALCVECMRGVHTCEQSCKGKQLTTTIVLLQVPGGLFTRFSEQNLGKAECGDVETAYDMHDLLPPSSGPSTF